MSIQHLKGKKLLGSYFTIQDTPDAKRALRQQVGLDRWVTQNSPPYVKFEHLRSHYSLLAEAGAKLLFVTQPVLRGQKREVPLDPILDAINDGRKRLLAEDVFWDEDSEATYSESTVNKAGDFLAKYAHGVWDHFGKQIPVPKLLPGPEGAVDILWEEESFELLLSVPEQSHVGDYYGQNSEGENTKGIIHLDREELVHGLVLWLAQ